MKKIFTLLFFAGCLTTAAFAQDGGRHRQNDNQYNNDRNSSYGNREDRNGYGNDQQSQGRRGDDGYRDQRDHHDRDGWDGDHRGGRGRDHRDGWDGDRRGGWDGDGDRGFHRHYRDYDHDREVIAYPYGYSRPVASFQIIIGHRERH